MQNDIMIDLEAMNNTSMSAIISIGAVKFNVSKNRIEDYFYFNVDLQSSLDIGLKAGGETIKWWLKQDPEAILNLSEEPIVTIREALLRFSTWVGIKPVIWGNGAGFDNVVLANAYRLCGLEKPWKYYHDRCYRTAKNLYPEITLERTGIKHNALVDATYQAEHLMKILNYKSRGKQNG